LQTFSEILGHWHCKLISFGQLLLGMFGYAFHTSSPSKAKALGLLKAINNYFLIAL